MNFKVILLSSYKNSWSFLNCVDHKIVCKALIFSTRKYIFLVSLCISQMSFCFIQNLSNNLSWIILWYLMMI